MAEISTNEIYQSGFTGQEIENRLNAIWPVGSILLTVAPGNPSEYLHFGNWVRIEGSFLYAVTNTDSIAVASTGGSKNVTLTIDNIPAHTHDVRINDTSALSQLSDKEGYLTKGADISNNTNIITTTSAGKEVPTAVNIMPPYFAVNAWYRISDQ